MWHVSCNHKGDNTDTKCPLFKKSDDNTEQSMRKTNKFTLRKKTARENVKR